MARMDDRYAKEKPSKEKLTKQPTNAANRVKSS